MIIRSLSELVWRPAPIPSADLIHPDCRIVMLSEFRGDFSMSVLRPCDLPTLKNWWLDDKGRYWDARQLSGRNEMYPLNADLSWAWLVSFGG
jgi:hypothetical protein